MWLVPLDLAVELEFIFLKFLERGLGFEIQSSKFGLSIFTKDKVLFTGHITDGVAGDA